MFIVILIVFFILGLMLTSPKKQVKTTTCAKLHKWIYKDDGNGGEYMICSVCNKTPTQLVSEVKGIEI
jgi:hypothetical protein